MESQNKNPYHNPTPSHIEGERQADAEREKLCKIVLENERKRKDAEKEKKQVKKK